MVITTEDTTLDQAKQTPLDAIRQEIIVLFNNQIGTNDAIISDTIYDETGYNVDMYLRQLVIEQDLPLKDVRFTRIAIQDEFLFAQVCDYVRVYDVPVPNTSYVYFLESKDFAITIISIDLLDGTTRMYMEPMDISDNFLKQMWREALDKKNKKISPLDIPGVTKGFPKNWNIPHAGTQTIDKPSKRR